MDKGHGYFEGIDMHCHTALQNNSAGGIYIPTYWAIAPYPAKYYSHTNTEQKFDKTTSQVRCYFHLHFFDN